MIDGRLQISRWFTWKEALWLPQWGRLATEEDGLTNDIKIQLVKLFSVMDEIRSIVAAPIIVHCCYRPPEYNKLVNGAEHSYHMKGMAIDFHVKNKDCDEIRKLLEPKLKSRGLWMEPNWGELWIHLDTRYRK